MIPLFQGKTLDYLLERQAWAWLYGVNVYIAIQGDWAFSYLEHLWCSVSKSISILSGRWSCCCWRAGRAYC